MSYNESIDYDAYHEKDIEVDYDVNPTDLYIHISDSQWFETLQSIKENPIQARVWVVKTEDYEREESTCRFLPIHSACARQPPFRVVSALLEAYPDGACRIDDNGMCPLHYACANQASARVVKLLLDYYPEGRFQRVECSGALPIHLASQWGVSSIHVIEHLLKNNISLASARDSEGLSPLELAVDADYAKGRKEVINLLREAVMQDAIEESTTLSSSGTSIGEDAQVVDHSLLYEEGGASNDRTILTHDDKEICKKSETIKKELLSLRNGKEFIESSVKDQIAYEWEAVNVAIEEMDKKVDHMIQKKILEHVKGKSDSTAPSTVDFPNDHEEGCGGSDECRSEIETIKRENTKIEHDLKELKVKYGLYHSKIETVEKVMTELANTMTRVATGHSATMARLQKMENDMLNVSMLRAAKLKELTTEIETMTTNINSASYVNEERKTYDVLKKEQEILDKMSDIIQTLKS